MSHEIATALRIAAERLSSVSDTARLDAELIMAHAMGVSREAMLLDMRGRNVPDSFLPMLERRARHEPVAYITGSKGFWDLELRVTEDVLIPRPDSETLIEAAEQIFADNPPCNILDMGTGSGALILAALSLFPDAKGSAVDSQKLALNVAQGNAERLGFSDRARFTLADWSQLGWAEDIGGPFDLIISNPPYIESGAELPNSVAQYEPVSALYSGSAGLDDYQLIIPQLMKLLSPDGIVLLETGASQAVAVSKIGTNAGFSCETKTDLAGLDRVIILRR